ncbi:MAG: arginine--tRNA ligase [Spirochaetes bacterium]|nr:arginine--tRNA ligase [Spirochaetota bacterium]
MKTVIERIKEITKSGLKKISSKYNFSLDGLDIEIEIPKEEKYGDYSTPVAFNLARSMNINPFHVARDLLETLNKINRFFFKKIDLVPPGFINFFLSRKFLLKELQEISSQKGNYGKADKDREDKIILEFVSANPTGPLNVVSARAASVGDALGNILQFRGKNVFKEYYINDAGGQVDLLGKSVLYRMKQRSGKRVKLPEDCYQGEYLIDVATEIMKDKSFYKKIKNLNEKESIEMIRDYTVKSIVKSQKKDLKAFQVEFDNWYSENRLRKSKAIDEVLDLLKKKGALYDNEGKVYFRSTSFGDEKDRVMVREDGTPTYFCVDSAYHLDKFRRGFTQVIDLWGPDHHGYIPRMKGVLQSMGFTEDSFQVFIVQQVNLLEKNEKIQMSKRAGNFVLMRDLLKDIGKDAARFFFLHRTLNSHLDFDMELARKQSDENPVFYVQYAHARICSIFKQAESQKAKLPKDRSKIKLDLLAENKEEIDLIKKLIDFPDTIREAALKFQPGLITGYLLTIAQLFHKFYTEHRVLTKNKSLTLARLYLVECIKIILKIALDLIGIKAPEKM